MPTYYKKSNLMKINKTTTKINAEINYTILIDTQVKTYI